MVRGADPEAHGRAVDSAAVALGADPALLGGVRRDCLVVGSGGGEDDRGGARAGLEGRHPGRHVLLEPPERGPRESPVLVALAVQAGGRRAELVGQGSPQGR